MQKSIHFLNISGKIAQYIFKKNIYIVFESYKSVSMSFLKFNYVFKNIHSFTIGGMKVAMPVPADTLHLMYLLFFFFHISHPKFS